MIIIHAFPMIIVHACTRIKVHACTTIIVLARTMIIVHACSMFTVHACAMIIVFGCNMIIAQGSCAMQVRSGARGGENLTDLFMNSEGTVDLVCFLESEWYRKNKTWSVVWLMVIGSKVLLNVF